MGICTTILSWLLVIVVLIHLFVFSPSPSLYYCYCHYHYRVGWINSVFAASFQCIFYLQFQLEFKCFSLVVVFHKVEALIFVQSGITRENLLNIFYIVLLVKKDWNFRISLSSVDSLSDTLEVLVIYIH